MKTKHTRERFNDLFHLFLVKITRLPQETALTRTQEKRLIRLFGEINKVKRALEK